MLTIENLKEFGANVEEGVARCMGLNDFYLKLVNMKNRLPTLGWSKP